MKEEKEWIEIKDIPYLYIDTDIFEGNIQEVSKNILNISKKLKEAYLNREKEKNTYGKLIPEFTPFNKYENIKIHTEWDYDGYGEIIVKAYRKESDDELKARLEKSKILSMKAKESARKRKLSQEKREKSLLETLKKKYENRI